MFATTILGLTLSAIWWTLILALWIIIAFWPAMMAKAKGYSFFLWLLISLFFWWITLFVVLFLPDKTHPAAATQPPADEE